MDQPLAASDIQTLRTRGLIGESETAFRSGDMIVAHNVVTNERRIINAQGLCLENSRRVLKG